MKSMFLLTLFLVLLTGCVSTKNLPIPEKVTQNLTGRSVVVAQREMPKLMIQTAIKAGLLGGIGSAIAGIAEGNSVIQRNNIEDPAYHIAEESITFLAERYGISTMDANGRMIDGEDASDIAATYSEADFVMDVRTINWLVVYLPFDWDSYIVRYSAKLRVIDTMNGASVAEGVCSRETEKEMALTYNQLMNNGAEGLKGEVEALSEQCIEQFKAETLVSQADN